MTCYTAVELKLPHLSRFANYLLEQRLDDYTDFIIKESFRINLPLLQYLSHLSESQLYEFSKSTNSDFLRHLAEDDMQTHLKVSMENWLSDQLPLIGKNQIEGRDITYINHLRGKTLKRFIPDYTQNLSEALSLIEEVDNLTLVYNSTSTGIYTELLKDRIMEESRFSSNVVNTSPGVTFVYDVVNDKDLYITGKVSEMTGFTPEEILGMENLLQTMIHPADMPCVNAFLEKVLTDMDGASYTADYRLRRKAGGYFWVRCYSVIYQREADGRPTQILGTIYDIESEKKTSLALEKREKELLEAQAIGHIGSFEWDMVNDVASVTPELKKIFELKEEEKFQEMMSKVHEEDRQRVYEALERSFKTGVYECEYRYRGAKDIKMIDARGIVTFDENGKPERMTGTVQDISRHKAIEEGLLMKTIELERINDRLRQFAYVASHDLKEPLRKIAVFSDIIVNSREQLLSEKTKVNIQKIIESSKRMQQLIDGLLAYSDLSVATGLVEYRLEDALQEALLQLECKISEMGASIRSDGLPHARVVPFQMQQLFQNLIANSLKFAKKELRPEITVTHTIVSKQAISCSGLKPAPRYLKIIFADNGIGFNYESAERIFGLFQRLHTRELYEGAGLGLAICRRIVESHGGIITAASEEGRGARFTIILPQGCTHFD